MSGFRWRTAVVLMLVSILVLYIGSRLVTSVAARDKATPVAASDEPDGAPKSGKKIEKAGSRKKGRPETTKKKSKGAETQTDSSSGTSAPANSTAGGLLPLAPGGSGTASSTGRRTGSAGYEARHAQAGVPSVSSSASSGNKNATGPGSGSRGGGGLEQGPNPELVKRVMEVQDRITPDLITQKGVVATSTGLDEDGNVVIKVYTTGADDPKIPKSAEGITVLEIVKSLARPLQGPAFNPAVRQPRPVPIGVSASGIIGNSCGPSLINSGSIGCRLKDPAGNVYALGCSHTFANENQGAVGDRCIQPSTFNLNPLGSCPPTDDIGTLFKFSPLIFINITDPNAAVTPIDAAAVATTRDLVGKSTPPPPVGYGTPHSILFVRPFLGLQVQKFGGSTGLTQGTVTGVNVTVLVPYFSGFVKYSRQLEVQPFILFAGIGDSGALVVTTDRFPIGMVTGEIAGSIIVTPIQDVLNFLGMTIDGDDADIGVLIPPGKEGRANPNSP